MSPEYLALAAARCSARYSRCKQPEDFFGFDFTSWVSPYTLGAHACGGVAVVLQDWASEEGLSSERLTDQEIEDIRQNGRLRTLLTNKRLESLLAEVLGLSLSKVYATNIYPFVKPAGMSAPLSRADVLQAAREFIIPELRLANPELVLALGSRAADALKFYGCDHVALPHPAARIGDIKKHEQIWRACLPMASRAG